MACGTPGWVKVGAAVGIITLGLFALSVVSAAWHSGQYVAVQPSYDIRTY